MIIINYRPGGLGYYLLRTAHLTWPDTFGYSDPGPVFWESSMCRPDLFHANMSLIEQQQIDSISSMIGAAKTVMTNNVATIPGALLQQIRETEKIFTITYASDIERCQAAFLSWLSRDNQDNITRVQSQFQDRYQGYWEEFLIDIFDTPAHVEGTELRFANLGDLDELRPWLEAVKQQYGLQDPEDWTALSTQFRTIYDRNLVPVHAFTFYQDFQSLWLSVLDTPGVSRDDYRQTLDAAQQAAFKAVMDFCEDYSPQMSHEELAARMNVEP